MGTPRKTPEAKLATYWRRRARLDYSDFDAFDPAIPRGRGARQPAIDFRDRKREWGDIAVDLAHLIAAGYPLSHDEYHVAIALHYTMGEVPYETSYRRRWHETADRRGYGSLFRPAGSRERQET